MKTVRRLLFRDIVSSVLFVAAAFLSLFFFIDFVDEIGKVGRSGYTVGQAALSSLLKIPSYFYELFPIAVLIGTIFSLTRMAQASEYTILRTAGLAPVRALGLLTTLGLFFAVCTFLMGDYVAPPAERASMLVRAQRYGSQYGVSGAWLRDRALLPEGERTYSVSLRRAVSDTQFEDVRIFEFDALGRLLSRTHAGSGRVDGEGVWTLSDVQLTRWPVGVADNAVVHSEHRPTATWHSRLTTGVVAAALLPVTTMSTVELWRYTGHLTEHKQASQRHALRLWRKVLYPFACIVMVALALPFAYLQARSGGASLKVFGGILLGISFVLLDNVAGHLGLLHGWTPWVVAAVPSLLYLMMSLGAFWWLVRYR